MTTAFKPARLGVFALGLLSASSAFAVWNAAADFSVTNGNPNGTWSYGVKGPNDPTGPLSLYPNCGNTGDWLYWHDDAHLYLGAPAASKRIAPTPMHNIQPGEASLHGGPGGEVSTMRWLAPYAATFHVTGKFGAGDGGRVDVFIGSLSGLLLEYRSARDDVTFDFTRTLLAGEWLDFMVGTDGDFYYDSTPIHASIDPVPEPMGVLGLALGFVMLSHLRRRAT